MFEPYLTRWSLSPDGEAITTPSSRLLPVLYGGRPAMLKVALVEEEREGGGLMLWWDGVGTARVLEHDEEAILLERAAGTDSLTVMAEGGRDEEATRIICGVAARLHAPRREPPPPLVSLERWFRALWAGAGRYGGLLLEAHDVARDLIASEHDVVPLHGDLHHGNVLHFGERGWLAIDPKHLIGERAFDFANLFRNPNLAVAAAPGRLAAQARVIAEAAGVEPRRLLQWTLALCGLSAAWHYDDGDEPTHDLTIARIALAQLH